MILAGYELAEAAAFAKEATARFERAAKHHSDAVNRLRQVRAAENQRKSREKRKGVTA